MALLSFLGLPVQVPESCCNENTIHHFNFTDNIQQNWSVRDLTCEPCVQRMFGGLSVCLSFRTVRDKEASERHLYRS